MRKGTFRQSALIEIRIVAGHPWRSGIGPGPNRMIGVAVLGPQMLQTRWLATSGTGIRLGRSRAAGIDVEMARRPVRAAMDLQQLAALDEIADRH